MSGIFGASQLFFAGGDTGFYGFPVNNSLRFDDGATSYLARTPSSTSNRQTWTFSAWVKRNNLGTQQFIWAATAASTDRSMIYFDADDTLRIYFRETGVNLGRGSGSSIGQASTAVFRDTSAWYHILVAFDSTQANASSPSRADANRLKFYVNGVQQTNDTSQTFANYAISQNANSAFNKVSIEHTLGIQGYDDGSKFDGYLAEVNFVDGLQLTPSSFAETKSGVWIPKEYTGVYGTNGFRLDFSDSTYEVKLADDFDNLNNWTTDSSDSRQTSGAAFTTSSSNVTVSSYGSNNSSYHGPVVYNDLSSQNIDRFILRLRNLSVGNLSQDLHSTFFRVIDTNDDTIVQFSFSDGHATDGTNNINFNGGGTGATLVSGAGLQLVNEFIEMERIGTNYLFRCNTNIDNDQNVSGSSRTNVKWVIFSHAKYQTLATPNMTLDKLEMIAYSSGFYQDKSGNNNDFVPYGLYGYDVMPDSPTNNFNIMNIRAVDYITQMTYASGALFLNNSTVHKTFFSNLGLVSGKWYWEAKALSSNKFTIGISNVYNQFYEQVAGTNAIVGHQPASSYLYGDAVGLYADGLDKNGSSVDSSLFGGYAAGDIFAIAFDADNGKVWFSRNGTWANSGGSAGTTLDPSYHDTTVTTGHPYVACFSLETGTNWVVNFGQDDSFLGNELQGSYQDENNIGKFKYPVPSGFLACCASNLNDPTISPVNDELPEDHFDTLTWLGTGSALSISGLEFAPDFVWLKNRDHTDWNNLMDTVRGNTSRLSSNELNPEDDGSGIITSFDSSGFSVGSNSNSNRSADNFIAWNWRAGGSTPSQTYVVKVVSDSGNKYRFDDFGTSAVTLDLQEGGSYIFNMDDASNASHPFSIGTSANSTVYTSGITYFLDGVSKTYSQYTSGFSSATTRRLHFTVPASAPVLYYWCSVHSGMGGQINTNAIFGSSNFSGSIQSRVSANVTAGFSIVAYNGNTTAGATVGHGLSSAPEIVIVKDRDSASDHWWVYHRYANGANSSDPETDYFVLSGTGARADNAGPWNDTQPTSSVFTIGANGWTNSNVNYISYLFHSVEGYSKVFAYNANGNANTNVFVYTGFRPRFIIGRRSNAVNNWFIHDTTRDTENFSIKRLFPNLNAAESTTEAETTYGIDFLSNGFKILASHTTTGASDAYIFVAFAEIPEKYSRAR